MNIALAEVVADLRCHRLGLGDLLRLQTIALEHVLEVHVAADVQLVRAIEDDATVFEELRHDSVGDGRPDLALDVVADDRQAGVLELLRPLRGPGDEDRQGVDESAAGIDRALGVELGGCLGSNREIADNDIGPGCLECGDDVDRLSS